MRPADHASAVRARVESLYRDESRRVLATLIRLLGDFELAEEALHEAFAAAMAQWPREGLPGNPRAWLVSAGRNKAVDALRRRARYDTGLDALPESLLGTEPEPLPEDIADDRLRLIFTCCHPALSPEAQVALTLRSVCDLSTEEIARAFLTPTPTVAQRIVRAKAKIRDARIPYQVPDLHELPQRLDSVLQTVYLVFNEGYSATAGDMLLRAELTREAIRLGRLLVELLPDTEAVGLLALMLLHDARRYGRIGANGELIPLEEQDRSRWDRAQIREGAVLVRRALSARSVGRFAVQAAIAALHAEAASAERTDWNEIVGLYDLLQRMAPSPVIALNRAAAVAMRDGAEAGLELIDAVLADGTLDDYAPAHTARAELCRRLGRSDDARRGFERALDLTVQAAERGIIQRRLNELGSR